MLRTRIYQSVVIGIITTSLPFHRGGPFAKMHDYPETGAATHSGILILTEKVGLPIYVESSQSMCFLVDSIFFWVEIFMTSPYLTPKKSGKGISV